MWYKRRGREGCRVCARAGSSSSSHTPNLETREMPASLVTKTGFHDREATDDTLSQAMLQILRRAKIIEEVKRAEHQNCDKERGRNKRDLKTSSLFLRPKKKARVDGAIRVGASVVATGQQPCADCGRRHQGECWKRTGACLRCDSLKHHIRECPRRPDQMQAPGLGITQPPRGVQQPPIGRGEARG
ncbi:uncharacterized protein [Gossypium hirsutum]|uniref:Uncharacterized protein n=1 Tax=Gossypium hirsutum TaxID=3635 RepID=A0ABM3BJA7_GOSHI|nr:uncharacterized protein LOC121228076 [Gossypium hirsutum]